LRREYIVTKIGHIVEDIIPFFEKYPVGGSKYFSYLDFKRVANIINNKEHLNPDAKGLEQILQIKNGSSLINKNKATNNRKDGSGKD
jgi:hypothetical protein